MSISGYTTYSFEDVSMTISHPDIGQYVAHGAGIGTITTAMAADRTTHDVSADGSVMISKLPGPNGTISLAIQQTSDLDKWLLKAYNYVDHVPASAWAGFLIIIRSPMMQDLTTAIGVSFQKLRDKPYQAQGQQVTWALMAAKIQQDVV